MAAEKTQGIVIRSVDFSETSKVVTLFTEDLGKIAALAKGGRRLRGGFEVSLDLISVVGIGVLRKPSAELDLLTEAVLVERFAGLRKNLGSLYGAYYVAELLDAMTARHDPHPGLFEPSVSAVRRLADGGDQRDILASFQLRLLKELGIAPRFDACARCGDPLNKGPTKSYNPADGGLICGRCGRERGKAGAPIRDEVIECLLAWDEGAQTEHWSRSARADGWRVVTGAVTYHLARRPKLLDMLML